MEIFPDIFLYFLFGLCFVMQLIFWLGFYVPLIKVKPSQAEPMSFSPFVSVIVVFKNEAETLGSLITQVLRQNYPSFELILVDDYSTDNSFDFIQKFITDKRLKFLKPKKDVPGKKEALKEAISMSKGSIILLTDADCNPLSHRWIQSMVEQKTIYRDIVLGYSPYKRAKGLLNKFIRFEGWITAVQYLSFALKRIPYMGVGRNLLYSRDLFMRSDAFENDAIASGDDDLFINKVANDKNITITLNPDSFVESYAKKSVKDFFSQKRRHMNTSVHYKLIHKLLLTGFAFSQIGVWLLFFLSFLFLSFPNFIMLTMLFLLSVKWILSVSLMKKLIQQDLVPWFLLLDFLLSVYFLAMIPFPFIPKNNWN